MFHINYTGVDLARYMLYHLNSFIRVLVAIIISLLPFPPLALLNVEGSDFTKLPPNRKRRYVASSRLKTICYLYYTSSMICGSSITLICILLGGQAALFDCAVTLRVYKGKMINIFDPSS